MTDNDARRLAAALEEAMAALRLVSKGNLSPAGHLARAALAHIRALLQAPAG